MWSRENIAKIDVGLSQMSGDLKEKATSWGCSILDRDFAVKMDQELQSLRHMFHYPKNSELPKSK